MVDVQCTCVADAHRESDPVSNEPDNVIAVVVNGAKQTSYTPAPTQTSPGGASFTTPGASPVLPSGGAPMEEAGLLNPQPHMAATRMSLTIRWYDIELTIQRETSHSASTAAALGGKPRQPFSDSRCRRAPDQNIHKLISA
jgi:hypothetical protein